MVDFLHMLVCAKFYGVYFDIFFFQKNDNLFSKIGFFNGTRQFQMDFGIPQPRKKSGAKTSPPGNTTQVK